MPSSHRRAPRSRRSSRSRRSRRSSSASITARRAARRSSASTASPSSAMAARTEPRCGTASAPRPASPGSTSPDASATRSATPASSRSRPPPPPRPNRRRARVSLERRAVSMTGRPALLFPGQGSQKVGMGAELARADAAARRVFDEADEVLGEKLSRLLFEGPEDQLTLTRNAQPAILVSSIALLRALESVTGGPFEASFAAGHSLGEWTALVAAGVLDLADAVRLVRLRGDAMQKAVPAGTGGMAAILGLGLEAASALCDEAREGEVCSPANLNGGGQIVIAGHTAAVERAVALAKSKGARRAVVLKVSAPFHSSLMA